MGRREAQGTSRRLNPGSCRRLAPAGGQVQAQKVRRKLADHILLLWGRISAYGQAQDQQHIIVNKTLFENCTADLTPGPLGLRGGRGGQIFCGCGKAATPFLRASVTALMTEGAGLERVTEFHMGRSLSAQLPSLGLRGCGPDRLF